MAPGIAQHAEHHGVDAGIDHQHGQQQRGYECPVFDDKAKVDQHPDGYEENRHEHHAKRFQTMVYPSGFLGDANQHAAQESAQRRGQIEQTGNQRETQADQHRDKHLKLLVGAKSRPQGQPDLGAAHHPDEQCRDDDDPDGLQ